MSEVTLRKRLKDEMEKQHWTGRKLSQEANLSYNAVHYILSGKNKSTNFEVVKAIADVLEVSPFYLLDENYEKENTKQNTIKSAQQIDPNISYDGVLYRKIMCIVEELLEDKNNLTFDKVEYFTRHIYPHVQKMGSKEEGDLKSYIEGIIDYTLNTNS